MDPDHKEEQKISPNHLPPIGNASRNMHFDDGSDVDESAVHRIDESMGRTLEPQYEFGKSIQHETLQKDGVRSSGPLKMPYMAGNKDNAVNDTTHG